MLKKEILSLISTGETEKAIKILLELTYDEDKDLRNEIIFHSAKYEAYKKSVRTGAENQNALDTKFAQIHGALIDIVEKLPEISAPKTKKLHEKYFPKKNESIAAKPKGDALKNSAPSEVVSKKAYMPYLAIAALLVAIGIGWVFSSVFNSSDEPLATEEKIIEEPIPVEPEIGSTEVVQPIHSGKKAEEKEIDKRKVPAKEVPKKKDTVEEPAEESSHDSTPATSSNDSAAETVYVTDSKGNRYKTVKLNGKRWLQENLNFVTHGSWNYNKVKSKKHGRLYTWKAAIRACNALGDGNSWRLPTDAEWKQLASSYNGYYMVQLDASFKAVGDNPAETFRKMQRKGEKEFAVLLSGRRDKDENFNEQDNIGMYWTSNAFDNNLAWTWMLMKVDPNTNKTANSNGPFPWPKTNAHSCRCIEK